VIRKIVYIDFLNGIKIFETISKDMSLLLKIKADSRKAKCPFTVVALILELNILYNLQPVEVQPAVISRRVMCLGMCEKSY